MFDSEGVKRASEHFEMHRAEYPAPIRRTIACAIAKKASISVRTVQRAVNSLVRAGYLRMEKHAGGSASCRDDRRPHRYTINLGRLRGGNTTTRNLRHDFEADNDTTSTPVTERLSRPKKHLLDPPKETPGFFDFWTIYPKKVAKKAALQAYEKAIKETDPAVIAAGARRYAEDPNRHPSYTANAATWLNAERWLDEPLPDRELSIEEKREIERKESERRRQLEREAYDKWQAELEEAKNNAAPMPESFKEELRKLLRK
jgi:hypothetical protein